MAIFAVHQTNRDMLLKHLFLAGAAVLFMGSCDSNTAKANESAKKSEEKAEGTPVQQASMEAGFVNGITEANSGITKGEISLRGKFDRNMASNWIYLYETEGSLDIKIDSTQLKDNVFDFGTKTYELGIYQLGLGSRENNLAPIILNPAEKEVELGVQQPRLINGLYAVNSPENTAWLEYSKAENAHDNAIQTLRKQAGQNQSMRARFEQEMAKKERELKALQAKMAGEHPNTFFAKLMTWKQNPYSKDKAKFWTDIDWSDESLVHTPIVSDRIQTYMRSFSGGNFNGFCNATDLTIQVAETGNNDRVKAFVINTLLEGFYSSGKDDVCAYIMDSYVFGEDCGDGDYAEFLKERAAGVKNLQIGGTPPDFVIDGHDGKKVQLAQEVAKNKYTLVMFWSSWCHKCEQEIPVLQQVYETYHSKGFEVVGVSMDTGRDAWLGAINERGLTWPNVSQLMMWQSPVAKDYRVHSTPTLFLIDQDMNLVAKPKRIYEVENFLQQNI